MALFEKKIEQPQKFNKERELHFDELLEHCIQGSRPAWEEFFRRYIPLIKNAINQMIKDQANAEAIKEDIFEQIVTDFVRDRLLEKCQDRKDFKQWLDTVSTNRTISWLRARGRLKRLPDKAFNEGAVSLSTPLSTDSETTLIDILPSLQKSDPSLTLEAEKALDTLENLPNWKQKWILRLSIAGQCPLVLEERKTLYSQCGQTYQAFSLLYSDFENDLTEKEKKKQRSAARGEILWHQIRQLEARILESAEEDRAVLRQQMAALAKRREGHLYTANRFIQPNQTIVANILGIGEEKANQISGLLARARAKMIKKHYGDEGR